MRSMGFILHAENTAIKFVLLVSKPVRVDFKIMRNYDFGITSLFEYFHVKRSFLYFFLRGPKKATSKGWHMCFEFGGNRINLISFFLQNK